MFHKGSDLYQRCVCVCAAAFRMKSQAGYQNGTKVGIYNVMTTACNATVPPGVRGEGNADVRSGGSFLMNLFMKMD